MKTKRFQFLLLSITLVFAPITCRAEITVSLKKVFVQQFKDKATISTKFRIDQHHNSANPIGSGSKDGDIHIAGRDSVVKLPMVSEIINGKKENSALKFLLTTTSGQSVNLTGVWRLWFEHPGSADQIQGTTVPPADDTNPDHIFEFHPVVQFGTFNLLDSFAPIKNGSKEFRGYPAETAFPAYEKRPAVITVSNSAIMISSTKAAYNYAEFEMRLAGKPKDVGDGFIVFANVYSIGSGDDDDPLFEATRRMVFVKGSAPAEAVEKLKKGDRLQVLGIPRVNLNEVFAIASGLHGDEVFDETLPYEMIIVAILK